MIPIATMCMGFDPKVVMKTRHYMIIQAQCKWL